MLKKYILMPLAVACMASCGNQNDWPDLDTDITPGTDDTEEEVVQQYSQYEGTAVQVTDLSALISPLTMSIAPDATPLEEYETVVTPESGESGYEDFEENFFYDEETGETDTGIKSINVTYTGSGAIVQYYNKKGKLKRTLTDSGTFTDVNDDDETVTEAEVTIDGQHVTIKAAKKFRYTLSGTGTEGSSFRLYSDKKYILNLADVTLANDRGPAISLQKAWNPDEEGNRKGKRAYIVLTGTNTLSQTGETVTDVADEDDKGVMFSEGKVLVSGTGTLSLSSSYNNGLATDDYVYLHAGPVVSIETEGGYRAVKANDGVTIGGGVLNIACDGRGARGIDTDSTVVVKGGRTTIVNAAHYTTEADEVKLAYGVKAAGVMVEGGELSVLSTGIGTAGIKADNYYVHNDGTVKVKVLQQTAADLASPDHANSGCGIVIGSSSESTGEAYLNGGVLAVYASGGTTCYALRAYRCISLTGSIVSLYSTISPAYYAKGAMWEKGGHLAVY